MKLKIGISACLLSEHRRYNGTHAKENFLMQVYAYADMQAFLKEDIGFKELILFHTRYKYFIYAKSHKAYKNLGSIVANHDKKAFDEVLELYKVGFYQAIAQESTRANNYNIMQHIYGYFKDKISADEKLELLRAMDAFKSGVLPMTVIIKMLCFYSEKFNIGYLKKQVYLKIYPEELALRNARAFYLRYVGKGKKCAMM